MEVFSDDIPSKTPPSNQVASPVSFSKAELMGLYYIKYR